MINYKMVEDVFKKIGGPYILKEVIWTNKDRTVGKFEIKNEKRSKYSTGLVSFHGNRIKFDIKFTNYDHKYLRAIVRTGFQGSRIFEIDISKTKPNSGDVVVTNAQADVNITPNTSVQLTRNQKYFAINDDNISCNGEFFGETFNGTFLEHINRKCLDGPDNAPVNRYSKIKLI